MAFKKTILFLTFLFCTCISLAAGPAAESGQQINDFSLSGFGDKGKKAWDLSGKSADILNEVVKLKEVVGNHYTDKDSVKLTADKGDFNKDSGLVHLEDNVVITSSGGARLTTDSLDWDRKKQIISTLDRVNLQKQDMNLSGIGAKSATALKTMELEREVRLDIQPAEDKISGKEKIMITCDGPLEVNYEKNIAVFNNNVKVEKPDLTIYSDRMQVYFSPRQEEAKGAQESLAMASSIKKIIAQGNVRILRGENTTYSQEAIYDAVNKKITLTGRPQIIIYQAENILNSQ